MQITIDQTEMEEAIVAYIQQQGLGLGSEEPKITFTAGRAPSGMTASIELSNVMKKQLTNQAVPAKPKPKAKSEPDIVEDIQEEFPDPLVDPVEEEPPVEKAGSSIFGNTDMLTDGGDSVTSDTLFTS